MQRQAPVKLPDRNAKGMEMDHAAMVARWRAACPDPEADPLAGMAQAGLFDPLPSYAAIARIKGEIAASTGLMGVSGIWSGRHVIARFFLGAHGTTLQQAAWVGRALSVAISEPKVGAHPKLLTTRATAVDSGWRIDGEKAWVSNGPIADAIIVIAITAETDGRKRYGAFIVPRSTPGVSMQEMPGFHALRPSRHCHLRLDGVAVPAGALLGEAGSAYERMALPFRDAEDAVGAFALLGALRFLLQRLAAPSDESAMSLGGLVALAAVFEAGAEQVVADLDAGRLGSGSATLVGLRVLASDMLARARTHRETFGPRDDTVLETILADLDASLGVARGPRAARQARLATTLTHVNAA